MDFTLQELDEMLGRWERGLVSFVAFPCAHFGLVEALYEILTTESYPEELFLRAQTIADLLRKRQRQAPRIGYVYLMQGGGYCKIGRSADPSKRIEQISPVLPFSLTVTHIVCAYDHVEAERFFQRLFSHKHTNGEWFVLNDQDIAVLTEHYGFLDVSETPVDTAVAYQNRLARNITEELDRAKQGQGYFSFWLP